MATIKWPFCYTEFHVMCQALEMLEMEMDDDDSSVQHGTFRTPSESFTDALQKRLDELVHVAVSSDQQRHVLQRLCVTSLSTHTVPNHACRIWCPQIFNMSRSLTIIIHRSTLVLLLFVQVLVVL
eukprot:m.65786 g.65786  ORF g.65786 m.65786 type:complete len:125 (+) comp8315_c0_seq1:269-643(+)